MNAEGFALLQKLKLWQVVLVLGIGAPFASHYGWNIEINYAVLIFLGMTGVAIIIRYFPPPEKERRKPRPQIAVSAKQSAFCSQFDQWIGFDKAVETGKGPEDKLPLAKAHEKIRQLRLELGTAQRVVLRKVEDGNHYVKYFRADDATTFVPSGGEE